MTDRVDRLLSEWRASGHVWGVSDCLLSVGDYIAACGGLDVSSRFRGTYDTEAGALAHKAANGGVCGLIDQTGLERIAEPARGDVVAIDTGEAEVGGICTGPGVVLRIERGVVEIERRFIRIVQAWKVP